MSDLARTPGEIDEKTRAALGRLTAGERECLERRLRHQTAKEMALELGISPHAVEKRLKMARAKLGLSSSLEAARLLAALDGYQQTGPWPSDLAGAPAVAKDRRHRPLILGALIMFIAAAAALVLAAQSTGEGPAADHPPEFSREELAQLPQPAPPPNTRRLNGRPIVYRTAEPTNRVDPTKTEIHMVVTTTFRVMDENESGFIEQDETPVPAEGMVEQPIYRRNAAGKFEPAEVRRVSAAQARAEYIALGDENGDGKWDFSEYRKWMTPHVVRNGISAEWRAEIESAY